VLNVRRAAERAGVSTGLVYVWVDSGVLTHYRMGKPGCRGSIRIAEPDLDAFLASLRRGEGPKESVPPAQKRKVILKHLRLKG
jgi:excisionase family DNA binding protein